MVSLVTDCAVQSARKKVGIWSPFALSMDTERSHQAMKSANQRVIRNQHVLDFLSQIATVHTHMNQTCASSMET